MDDNTKSILKKWTITIKNRYKQHVKYECILPHNDMLVKLNVQYAYNIPKSAQGIIRDKATNKILFSKKGADNLVGELEDFVSTYDFLKVIENV